MRLLLASAAFVALTACAHNIGAPGAEDATPPAAGAPMAGDMSSATPTQALPFVAMAGASDMFEIQSSQIALQKTQNPQVRQYAQMLIDHHQMTTQQVTAAAQQAGLTPPPPMLMPMQQQMIDQLQSADAAGFDAVYLRQQVPAHQMALRLHQNYAARGDTPSLKQAAGSAVPIVTQHLQQAQAMLRGM